MKKIKVGIAKEIDFKVYNYDKTFELRNISKNNLNFDVIIITSSTKISHKIINKYKNLKAIFIMSLHLLSRIKLDKHVIPLGLRSGFVCAGVMVNSQDFTKTSNIWGVENMKIGTNTNRIVLFHKSK